MSFLVVLFFRKSSGRRLPRNWRLAAKKPAKFKTIYQRFRRGGVLTDGLVINVINFLLNTFPQCKLLWIWQFFRLSLRILHSNPKFEKRLTIFSQTALCKPWQEALHLGIVQTQGHYVPLTNLNYKNLATSFSAFGVNLSKWNYATTLTTTVSNFSEGPQHLLLGIVMTKTSPKLEVSLA